MRAGTWPISWPPRCQVLDALARRAVELGANGRSIIGIVGCPGAGKSTLAELLLERLDPSGSWVVRVPMDGFHLADAVLDRLARRDRKGAIDTFDGHGYLAVLRRIRAERDHAVYAPDFDRVLEQPIAGAIAVNPYIRLVITEGNYLLAQDAPWPDVRGELDEVWYVDLDDTERRRRLVARHVEFGKTPGQARSWVDTVDEPNARLIAAQRHRADRRVDMSAIGKPVGAAPMRPSGSPAFDKLT